MWRRLLLSSSSRARVLRRGTRASVVVGGTTTTTNTTVSSSRAFLTTSEIEERMRRAAEGGLDHKSTKTHRHKIPLDVSRHKHVAVLTPPPPRGGRSAGSMILDQDMKDMTGGLDDDVDMPFKLGGGGYLTASPTMSVLGGSDDSVGGGGLVPPGSGGGGAVLVDPVAEQERAERELKRQLLHKYHEKDALYYWKEHDYDPVDIMPEEVPVLTPPPPPPEEAEGAATAAGAAQIEGGEEEEASEEGEEASEEGEEGGGEEREEEEDDDLTTEEGLDRVIAKNESEVVEASDWDRHNDILTMLSDDYYPQLFEHYTDAQIEARSRQFNTIQEGIDFDAIAPTTRYECETHDNPHPNMLREPKPLFWPHTESHRRHRVHPPPAYVEQYHRFLYVTNLPPLHVDGKRANVNNSTHHAMVKRAICEALGSDSVESIQVYATDASSGFVGFDNEVDVAKRLSTEPKQPVLISPHRMTLGMVDDSGGFGPPGTVLKLDHIPASQHTPQTLWRELFPPRDSNEGAAFDGIEVDDIKFVSATTALIRCTAVDQALHTSNSKYVQNQLERLSQYPLHIFRARRELIHQEYGEYPMHEEIRKFGPRLIVDGDMPTKPFYTSHAGVLHVSNLDPTASIYEISHVFQPYCGLPRDEIGSIEFIRCERGHSTGRAFIGFDLPGDAEAAYQALTAAKEMPTIGDRPVRLRLVEPRKYPLHKTAAPERRPDRTVEELEQDLYHWEQHVDPQDIQTLLNAGIRKEVLDDALRAMRQGNPLFGPLDGGMRDESLQPEKARGQQWRDMVRLYISTLIECLVTPDNPDSMPPLYEALHFPGEEVDMGIFEQERKRLEEQARFRSKFS